MIILFVWEAHANQLEAPFSIAVFSSRRLSSFCILSRQAACGPKGHDHVGSRNLLQTIALVCSYILQTPANQLEAPFSIAVFSSGRVLFRCSCLARPLVEGRGRTTLAQASFCRRVSVMCISFKSTEINWKHLSFLSESDRNEKLLPIRKTTLNIMKYEPKTLHVCNGKTTLHEGRPLFLKHSFRTGYFLGSSLHSSRLEFALVLLHRCSYGASGGGFSPRYSEEGLHPWTIC